MANTRPCLSVHRCQTHILFPREVSDRLCRGVKDLILTISRSPAVCTSSSASFAGYATRRVERSRLETCACFYTRGHLASASVCPDTALAWYHYPSIRCPGPHRGSGEVQVRLSHQRDNPSAPGQISIVEDTIGPNQQGAARRHTGPQIPRRISCQHYSRTGQSTSRQPNKHCTYLIPSTHTLPCIMPH